MSRTIATLIAAALVASAGTGIATAAPDEQAEPARPAAARAIPGQYLVTLEPGLDLQPILDTLGVRPLFSYGAVFTGFAARLSTVQVGLLRKIPGFRAIEPDAQIELLDHRSGPAAVGSWGLDRIGQRGLPLDNTYAPVRDGANITAYILDTGIEHSHREFGGRASFGYDAVGDGRMGVDCNGHGTHVAGTVGGATFGVAKRVKLVSVRVLGCTGGGTLSSVVAGFDWISANARKPAVVNVSLGGSASPAVDAATNATVNKGVFVAAAGGNDGADACGYSPARAAKAFTIGATTRTDGYATYSNRGQCVQLLAPGTDITSAWIGGAAKTISGTSMATPHVTGVAALYKQKVGDRPQEDVMNWMWSTATQSKITAMPANTPNYLLFTGGL